MKNTLFRHSTLLVGFVYLIANPTLGLPNSSAVNNTGGKLDVYINSDKGDPLGQGEQRHLSFDNMNLSFGTYMGKENSLELSAGGYNFHFQPSSQDGWHTGKYNSGLNIDAFYTGCNTSSSNFEIFELDYDATTNKINKLALDLEYHCEGLPPALHSAIRFNSDYPVKGYDTQTGYTDITVKFKCDVKASLSDDDKTVIGYYCPNMSLHADYYGCGRTIPDTCDSYPIISDSPVLNPTNLPQKPVEKTLKIRVPNDAVNDLSLILITYEPGDEIRVCSLPFANKTAFTWTGWGNFEHPIEFYMGNCSPS